MSEPFLAEVRIVSFNYAARGWAMCNGQLLPINQNQALFSLLGTQYGGDGRVNFALPDLRGRVPIHVGAGFTQGQNGGEQAHTLTLSEMPQHTHTLQASTNGTAITNQPATTHVPSRATTDVYASASPNTTLNPASVTNLGGSQAHLNMQPFLTLTFMIALIGIFPSQN